MIEGLEEQLTAYKSPFLCHLFHPQQFQKEQVDPLQLKLQQVNGVGQGLIQSAGKNCDVQGLEHDMEEINTRWNTLNKKVRAWGRAVPASSGVWGKEGVPGRELRLQCQCLTLQWGCFWGAGGPASGSAAGGSVALWEVPGRPGATAELAGRHRGAHLQPETSLC